jgi:hypothetical protein
MVAVGLIFNYLQKVEEAKWRIQQARKAYMSEKGIQDVDQKRCAGIPAT